MLRFHVGPFPVKVYPSFLIIAVIFGMGGRREPWMLAAWVFVVFVSVLVHELGHAIVGRTLGGTPEIHLEGLGGVTYPNLQKRPGALKSIALSFAGPFFGLLLGGAAWLLERAWPPGDGSISQTVVRWFQWTSIIWAVFNLMPILPLDGGNIMLAAIEGVRKKPSAVIGSWVSAVIAGLAALATYLLGWPIMALWCALYAIQNGMRAHALKDQEQPVRSAAAEPRVPHVAGPDAFEQTDVRAAIDRTRELLVARDVEGALAIAEKLEQKGGAFRQSAGLRLRAGIELSRGDNEAAALYAGQSYSVFQNADAAVVAARANLRAGQEDRAKNWVRRAVDAGASVDAVGADAELGAFIRQGQSI